MISKGGLSNILIHYLCCSWSFSAVFVSPPPGFQRYLFLISWTFFFSSLTVSVSDFLPSACLHLPRASVSFFPVCCRGWASCFMLLHSDHFSSLSHLGRLVAFSSHRHGVLHDHSLGTGQPGRPHHSQVFTSLLSIS